MKLVPLILLLGFCFPVLAGEPVEREVYLMGTSFKATIFENDRMKGLQEVERIVQAIEKTEDQLSTWRPSSELSQINRQNPHVAFQMSHSLCEVMQKVQQWSELTENTFDPTVGNLLKAWSVQEGFRVADKKTIQAALRNTGFSHVEIHDCSIRKDAEVLFDAGAFGKGEALDRAMKIASAEKFGTLVMDFGGQVAVWDLKQPLSISVANPADRIKASGVIVPITSGSLSTSGGSERDGIVNGRRISHIVDPRAGYPVPFFGSVTVWYEHALEADILSTALYVMGPENGRRWAEKHGIAACFLFNDGKKPEMTVEFSKLLHRVK